jgi:hypothetical protein
MTIVHDNECLKHPKTITKKKYILINNSTDITEIRKFKTDEHYDQKCKFNSFLFLTLPHV